MQYSNYIQPAVHTDIRNSKKQSRLRMALAGSGIASALLLGGLFGSHAGHPVAQGQAHMAKTSAIISHGVYTIPTSHMATAQMSYTTANDYVGMARQAALNAGISPDAFQRQIQQESGFNPGA